MGPRAEGTDADRLAAAGSMRENELVKKYYLGV
jgi:hypothetical protein